MWLIPVILYLLPTWIALVRHHRNGVPIFLTNLLLGWTFLFGSSRWFGPVPRRSPSRSL
jgi:hypothetical protein